MRYADIPRFPHSAYEVTVEWRGLERFIADHERDYGLDLHPDFQREHVWTAAQQVAFVEYQLKGGEAGRTLYLNCPGWLHGQNLGPYQIVDGRQRLEAVRAFLRGDILAFGVLAAEYEDHIRLSQGRFDWRVFTLASRADVLRLYLAINRGGTPHTTEELNRVQALLERELRG